jgi:hypothetical protein
MASLITYIVAHFASFLIQASNIFSSVENYDIKSGQLLIKHRYPQAKPAITASVDISLVRETLKTSVLQVGAWVNVVGYVMIEKPSPNPLRVESAIVKVQAIMLWDTVALNLDEYQSAVQARQNAGTTG